MIKPNWNEQARRKYMEAWSEDNSIGNPPWDKFHQASKYGLSQCATPPTPQHLRNMGAPLMNLRHHGYSDEFLDWYRDLKRTPIDAMEMFKWHNRDRVDYIKFESTLYTNDERTVLVIGAGKSITPEVVIGIDYWKYDIIIIAPPMARIYSELGILQMDNVYVVDGEKERAGFLWVFDSIMGQVQLIATDEKCIEVDWPLKELVLYDERGGNWPRSSGAVALKMALEYFKASRVDAYGFDLSGSYSVFEDETFEYLDDERVHRYKTLTEEYE